MRGNTRQGHGPSLTGGATTPYIMSKTDNRKLKRAVERARNQHEKLAKVDTTDMSPEDRARHEHWEMKTGLLYAQSLITLRRKKLPSHDGRTKLPGT